MATGDFVQNVQNLDGVLIGEKKKNFQRLLKTTIISQPSDIDKVLSDFQPTNYLETLLRVDALIYFRRTEDLWNILKGGNEVYISKIIKQQWFFKTCTFKPHELVNEVFPLVSYATRMKILKRLGQQVTEEQMNDIYDAVLNRYGLFIAKTILHTCSSVKISSVLQTNFVCLTMRQLTALYDKDRLVFETYLEMKLDKNITDHQKLFKYIAWKDPQYFITLVEKFGVSTSVGRRTTKKIVQLNKEKIVEKPQKYRRLLRKDKLVRELRISGLFRQFYQNLVIDEKYLEAQKNITCTNYLKLFPKKYQFDVYKTTFETVHHRQLSDHLPMIAQSDLQIIQDPDERHFWAMIKYKEDDSLIYIPYMKLSTSIQLLKEKIHFASNLTERSKLLKLLITSCAFHKDTNELLEVLKYICERHRNEENSTRVELLSTIEAKVELEKLHEEHWRYINEILTINRLRKAHMGSNTTLRQAYVEFLYRTSAITVEEMLIIWTDLYCRYGFQVHLGAEKPEIQRILFIMAIECIPKIIPNSNDSSKMIHEAYTDLIERILYFNNTNMKKKPELFVDLFQYTELVDELIIMLTSDCHFTKGTARNFAYEVALKVERTNVEEKYLKTAVEELKSNNEYFMHDFTERLLYQKDRSEFDKELLKMLYVKWLDYGIVPVDWILKHSPQLLVEYLTGFYKHVNKTKLKNYHVIKQYSHLDLDSQLVQQFKVELFNEDSVTRYMWVQGLATLMPTKEYLEMVEDSFLPKTDKIDLEDQQMKIVFQIQLEIAKTFCRIMDQTIIWPTLSKFCIGDYLCHALSSLYSFACRVPENIVIEALLSITRKAVSVRKHAPFLACYVLNQRTVIDILKNSGNIEKNTSSQKHLLSSTFEYLLKNPTDSLWELLKDFIKFVDKSDVETLEQLSNVHRVPQKYRYVFLEYIWLVYEDLQKNGEVNVTKYYIKLLNGADRYVLKDLSEVFFKKLVQQFFLVSDKKTTLGNAMNRFAVNYLVFNDKGKESIEYLFEEVSKANLDDVDSFFKVFTEEFVTLFSSTKKSNKLDEILSAIILKFKDLFHPIESFCEYVMVGLLERRLLVSGNEQEYARSVGKWLLEVTQKFGVYYVVETFEKLLNKTVAGDVCYHVDFCRDLFESNKSPVVGLLVLSLLENSLVVQSSDRKEKIVILLNDLQEIEDLQFKLRFNCFKKHNKNVFD